MLSIAANRDGRESLTQKKSHVLLATRKQRRGGADGSLPRFTLGRTLGDVDAGGAPGPTWRACERSRLRCTPRPPGPDPRVTVMFASTAP